MVAAVCAASYADVDAADCGTCVLPDWTHVQELPRADRERLRVRSGERQRLRVLCPHLPRPCHAASTGCDNFGQGEGRSPMMTGRRRASSFMSRLRVADDRHVIGNAGVESDAHRSRDLARWRSLGRPAMASEGRSRGRLHRHWR